MRVEDWNIRFVERLAALRASNAQEKTTFDWDPTKGGHFNCLTFSGYMVEAVTGENPYNKLAANLQYQDALGAVRILKDLGHDSVDQLIGSLYPAKRLSHIIRGDLVMVPANLEREALQEATLFTIEPEEPAQTLEGLALVVAVADPPWFWVVHSEFGLSYGSLSHAVKGFSVD